jgi:signal transduction histidine kinase
VTARLVVDELVSLPVEMEEALYRIAQEALNNTLKHAQASNVVVSLRTQDGNYVLEIEDDGVGFEPTESAAEAGLGLRNIKERAAALGATVDITSQPGAGTRLTVQGTLARISKQRGQDE